MGKAAIISAGCTLLIGAGASLGQQGADKLAYGKHLAQECTTCHRPDGKGSDIPPIVGLAPEYFVTTMKFYQAGARTHEVMQSVAASLNDEQLEALGAYLATVKPAAKAAQQPRKK